MTCCLVAGRGSRIVCGFPAPGTRQMAKPNYQFEKRQRELEKQKKKAAKANKKAPRESTPSAGTDAGPAPAQAPDTPAGS